MMERAEWAYIARTKVKSQHHDENTVVCAIADDPKRPKDTAKEVAKWMRDGLTIERVPVAWVREHFFSTTLYIPEAAP